MKLLIENFKSFINEQEDNLPQIYCDMDGVLVDFEKGVVDQINKDLQMIRRMADQKNLIKVRDALARVGRDEVVIDDLKGRGATSKPVRNYMYGRVGNDADFWYKLPWMPGGKELWAFIAPYRPHILTSPMKDPSQRGPNGSEIGKTFWIDANLKPAPNEVHMGHDKYRWAVNEDGSFNILIDDWDKNLSPWSYHTGGKKGGPYSKYAIQCANGNYQAAIAKLKEHGFS